MRLAFVGGILMALAVPAAAQEIEVYLQVGAPGQIDATVVGAPHLPADQFTLATEHGIPVKPLRLRTWSEGDEPIAVALVYAGSEIWLGNDDFETDAGAVHAGAETALERGLDTSNLAASAPAGSQFVAVSYATGARVRIGPEPMAKLAGRDLGPQWTYRDEVGSDLVQGVTLALDELDKLKAPRKALIVIGDGTETDAEVAKVTLAQLKKRAAREAVTVDALVVKSEGSDERTDVTLLTPHVRRIALHELSTELARTLRGLDDRIYLTFPGDRLPWDGREHDLILGVGRATAEPVTMTLGSPPQALPAASWWTWWRQLGAGALLVGAIALVRSRTMAG